MQTREYYDISTNNPPQTHTHMHSVTGPLHLHSRRIINSGLQHVPDMSPLSKHAILQMVYVLLCCGVDQFNSNVTEFGMLSMSDFDYGATLCGRVNVCQLCVYNLPFHVHSIRCIAIAGTWRAIKSLKSMSTQLAYTRSCCKCYHAPSPP